MSTSQLGLAFINSAFASRTTASSVRISYRSNSKWMSRRSDITENSFGLGLDPWPYAPEPARPGAPGPTTRSPSIDPPGAGAEASDRVLGIMAQPARIGAAASNRTRANNEERFTIVPPFREPWMGPRFDRGPRALRHSAHPMPHRAAPRYGAISGNWGQGWCVGLPA